MKKGSPGGTKENLCRPTASKIVPMVTVSWLLQSAQKRRPARTFFSGLAALVENFAGALHWQCGQTRPSFQMTASKCLRAFSSLSKRLMICMSVKPLIGEVVLMAEQHLIFKPEFRSRLQTGHVARASSRLCRGFPTYGLSVRFHALTLADAPPAGSRRYSRLETCATAAGRLYCGVWVKVDIPDDLRLEISECCVKGEFGGAGWS